MGPLRLELAKSSTTRALSIHSNKLSRELTRSEIVQGT